MYRKNTRVTPMADRFRTFRSATMAVEETVKIYQTQIQTMIDNGVESTLIDNIVHTANTLLANVTSSNTAIYEAYIAINSTFASQHIDEVFKATNVHDYYRLLVNYNVFKNYYTFNGFYLKRTVTQFTVNRGLVKFEFVLDRIRREDPEAEGEADFEAEEVRPRATQPRVRNPRNQPPPRRGVRRYADSAPHARKGKQAEVDDVEFELEDEEGAPEEKWADKK